MGTDIHTAVQKRNADGKWERVERLTKNEWRDEGEPEFTRDQIITDRSYLLFALLANVRNGFGFAGVVTHDPITPISDGRGFPEDFAEEMDDDCHEGTWMGDHSHTWVTLKEIEDYDLNKAIVKRSGWVNAPVRCAQLREGFRRPSAWSGGISGRSIKHVSISEMDNVIGLGHVDPNTYAELTWEEPLSYALEHFLDGPMKLLRYIADGKPEDVRIVMGFDS